MTIAENSVSEPPNLKFKGEGYPQTPLQGSWLLHSRKCPRYKKPSYGPAWSIKQSSDHLFKLQRVWQRMASPLIC